MPFKSVEQAYYMMINMPDVFQKWKKTYGLPKGYSEFVKKKAQEKKN